MNNRQKSDSYVHHIQISLNKEAYEYLRSLKSTQESFSDIIMKLKAQRKITGPILAHSLAAHTPPKKEYFIEREQSLRATRKQFEQ